MGGTLQEVGGASRLRGFKAAGGLGAAGRLRFMGGTGAYKLEFGEDGALMIIEHRSGARAKIAAKTGLSTAHVLRDNHCDFSACLCMPPMPDVKLAGFFTIKSREGPHSFFNYHGKPKDLLWAAEEIHSVWADTHKRRKKPG